MDGELIFAIILAIIICFIALKILKFLFVFAIRTFQFIGALAIALIPGVIIFFAADAALASTVEAAGVGATASVALAAMANSTLG